MESILMISKIRKPYIIKKINIKIPLNSKEQYFIMEELEAPKRSEENLHDITKPPALPSEEPEMKMEPTLPPYPTHGVIGNSEPDWLDIFHSTRKLHLHRPHNNFKKHKFAFYEFYERPLENRKSINEATPIPGLHSQWLECYKRGLKTSDVYDIHPNLPIRFRDPSLMKGYGWEREEEEHPLFRTTSSSYGKLPPTVHDVPHEYHGLKNGFTLHLTKTGMPKNRSLNIK